MIEMRVVGKWTREIASICFVWDSFFFSCDLVEHALLLSVLYGSPQESLEKTIAISMSSGYSKQINMLYFDLIHIWSTPGFDLILVGFIPCLGILSV